MSKDFDPRRARAKRPMPIWMDAFLRDTTHLEADEVGAYFSILGALWTSVDLSLPNCPRKLSRVARVSRQKWNARVGNSILPLLSVQNGFVTSARLKKEAQYVEKFVLSQHKRSSGQSSVKPLETKEAVETTDKTTENPGGYPSQQPNNPIGDDASHLCDFGMLNIFSGDLEKKSEPPKKSRTTAKKGTRLKENWFLPKDWGEWAIEYGLTYNQIEHEADTFRDYWLGKAGAAGVKLDWLATWRNWIRRNHNKSKRQGNGQFTNSTNGNGNHGSNPANGRGMAGSAAANEIASRATKWADKKETGG